MTTIMLTVPGPPVSQGSKNAYQRGKRVVLVETRHAELKDYRARVALVAAKYRRPMLDQPLHVDVQFVLARPAHPKFDMPAVPPDLDKYLRAIFDALTEAGIWKDDGRAVSARVVKRYCLGGETPHTQILVTRHDPQDKNEESLKGKNQ